MTTKKQRENCGKLADLLETVPARHFDMSGFVDHKPGCGTAGCALGWAALSGKFGAGWGVKRESWNEPTEWAKSMAHLPEWSCPLPVLVPARRPEKAA